ncbi:MAG: hypothetical protein HY905_06125 [Deltaproteobacteria bacterium]|nr:hypothetical protein [Deltaproteobacteria bacterium]
MASPRTTIDRLGLVLPLLVVACRCGGGDSTADADADAGCSFASCDEECRAVGRCYGSCVSGVCGCSTSCDGGGDADDVAPDDGGRDDATPVDDGGDVVVETREGGTAGITCQHVPTASRRLLPPAAGWRNIVAFSEWVETPSGHVFAIREYDSTTRSLRTLDDLGDVPGAGVGSRISYYPSIEGDWVAFGAVGQLAPDTAVVQLRLVNRRTGEKRVLATGSGDLDHTESVDFVVLRYPWVVWRQVSEETYWYSWTGWYMNIDTGEKAEIIPGYGGVVNLDLLGTTAVVSGGVRAVDLITGLATEVFPGEADQWAGVITPNWIAWLDQVEHPSGSWFSPYGTDVYGQNRSTGEIVPLVNSPGMHGPELDGEGDWLAYMDRRDEPNPWYEIERSDNIYALHLPTMTEVCVEDWPGYQVTPTVYQGTDGMRVFFFEDLGAATLFDLWDCNLPTPAAGDGP